MVSLLPLPGGFIAFANRTLSPSIVKCLPFSGLIVLGVRGWMGILVHVCPQVLASNRSYAIGIPTPLVAAASITSFWVPTTTISPGLWISVYLIAPIAFNFFNTRQYGEIEFWL